MLVALSLFNSLIAPFLLLLIWCVCLWRLRSAVLVVLTIVFVITVIINTEGNIVIWARNPYAMLTALTLVLVTVLLLPHTSETDRPYLIAVDSILLVMCITLEGWREFLKQSNGYFTDDSAFASAMVLLLVILLTLSSPLTGWLSRRGLRWGMSVIAVCAVISIFGAFWIVNF